MASRLACPSSALVAAGVVGQWEFAGKTDAVIYDRSGALFMFGDENMAGVSVPIAEVFALLAAEDQATAAAFHRTMTRDGGPVMMESRVASPTAGDRLVQVRGFFAWGEDGDVVGRGILLDVTDFHANLPSLSSGVERVGHAPQPSSDPLAEAAERSIELRTALGKTGHGALRLAADLLLWEINTAMAARHTISDKAVPGLSKQIR